VSETVPNEMDEIVAEFLAESAESLDRLDRDLLALERDPGSREVLASVFRTMHTIKGTCGFLGFGHLERVAHAAESLLAGLRDGSRSLTPEIAEILLRTGDALRAMLGRIGASGAEGNDTHDDLVTELERLRTMPSPRSPDVHPPIAAPIPPTSEPRAAVADTTVRVDVGLLDHLMTLVGELVLARNHLVQLADDRADPTLASASQGIDRITAELQDGVMKTRLQPVRTALGAFPRVVRDLAVALGKRARIETEGEDTELDRSIVEAIKDPLAHLIRNAIDHGIEAPDERLARGKPEEGAVVVRAYHEGGQVSIEVSDDGGGIDPTAIRAQAVERGILPLDHAGRLSDRQALELLFLPGFTTAERVTTVSGRGVGMDVVRTNVERIGGSVDVTSALGSGTTFKIRIPLTLAIVPALIVTSAGQRFAIPQANVLELVSVRDADLGAVHDARVFPLRDRLLPVLWLARELGATDAWPSAGSLVVVHADDRRFGLLVEGLSDSVEIVVKPLGRHLNGLDVFAGATILGDGCVAAIIDIVGLADRAGIEASDRGQQADVDGVAPSGTVAGSLLVFTDPAGGRMAVPLDHVDRLEAFPSRSVERAGADDVVRYGDAILPLTRLDELLLDRRRERRYPGEDVPTDLQVLVHRDGATLLGIVVGRIIDVVDEPLELHAASRPGVRGTMVLDGRVTEVLDLPALVGARNDRRSTGAAVEAGAAS
jgi:two-component system, chemotaxis family, sensor kinase CheA